MKIVLYVFLALCLFFIGVPVLLSLLRIALISFREWGRRRIEKRRNEEILRHLEQCKKCKFGGWIYDKERPTGDDARYHNGATYGVCCYYGKKYPLDSTFKEDPGEKCNHYEPKETEE